TPCLPLVIGPFRLDVDVFDAGFLERAMEAPDTLAHPLGFCRSDAEPQYVDFLCERLRIREDAVVVDLRVELAIPKHERAAGTAEAADVRKQIEVVERDLEGLHPAHRKAGHRAIVPIGQRTEGFV